MLERELTADRRGVLLNASVPNDFLRPWSATASDCSSITAVVSALDERGVDWLRDLAVSADPATVRVVLLVHAACPTKKEHLTALLTLIDPAKFQVWVLPITEWGQRCCWILSVRRQPPTHVFWNSSAGNFGLSKPAIEEAHSVAEADPLIVDHFISWFVSLVERAAPLSAHTAAIPALIPAAGTREGAAMWEEYEVACRVPADNAKREPSEDTSTQEGDVSAPVGANSTPLGEGSAPAVSGEEVENQIRTELRIPKPDALLQSVVQLFEKGDLVTIDKSSRIPPLEVPIKAEWFGIPSFREVGVISREVRYKISVLDEKTNKQLEARRKCISDLREKFSFPLADGSRWMPHKAKALFEAELKRLNEAGTKLLASLVSGNPEEWVKSKRNLVTRDANRQYEEFNPGMAMPAGTIDEILRALAERFQRATSGNFLPKVGFVRTSFRLSGDSDQISNWTTPRTLLRAIAEYPRAALKSRNYFFRGLKITEEELLSSMNVTNDRLIPEWFKPESQKVVRAELEGLRHIDESERSDRDKCALILDLLHRSRSIELILHLAHNKSEQLDVATDDASSRDANQSS